MTRGGARDAGPRLVAGRRGPYHRSMPATTEPNAPRARDEAPFERLKALVARLRRECPWDRKQRLDDCRGYLLEEAHELLAAIEARDADEIREELGDLAFLVAFTARIAEDEGFAPLDEAIETVIEKMIRRHPHVFGDAVAEHPDDVVANWTRIKREEKRAKAPGEAPPSIFDGLPRALPALLRAERMNTKAARVGFEWERIEDVWAKVDEEIGELREAAAAGDRTGVEEEVGDLLIAVANLARWLGVHPETALHRSLDKFDRRFRSVERALAAEGRTPEDADLAEMDAHWNRAKAAEESKP